MSSKTNTPESPRVFWVNYYPEHYPHWHIYASEREADDALNGHRHVRIEYVERSYADRLAAENKLLRKGVQQANAFLIANDLLQRAEKERDALAAELAEVKSRNYAITVQLQDKYNEWRTATIDALSAQLADVRKELRDATFEIERSKLLIEAADMLITNPEAKRDWENVKRTRHM